MSDPNWRLETSRLFISHFLPDSQQHVFFLLKLWSSPLLLEAEGPSGIDTPEKAQKVLQAFSDRQAKYGFGQYVVSLKPPTSPSDFSQSKPIGNVSLMIGDYTVPDLGFAILDEEHGKGYATEAAKAILKHAKELTTASGEKLGGVLGFTKESNARARRVFEKVGLEYRGVRNLVAFQGKESAVYALPEMGDLKQYGIID